MDGAEVTAEKSHLISWEAKENIDPRRFIDPSPTIDHISQRNVTWDPQASLAEVGLSPSGIGSLKPWLRRISSVAMPGTVLQPSICQDFDVSIETQVVFMASAKTLMINYTACLSLDIHEPGPQSFAFILRRTSLKPTIHHLQDEETFIDLGTCDPGTGSARIVVCVADAGVKQDLQLSVTVSHLLVDGRVFIGAPSLRPLHGRTTAEKMIFFHSESPIGIKPIASDSWLPSEGDSMTLVRPQKMLALFHESLYDGPELRFEALDRIGYLSQANEDRSKVWNLNLQLQRGLHRKLLCSMQFSVHSGEQQRAVEISLQSWKILLATVDGHLVLEEFYLGPHPDSCSLFTEPHRSLTACLYLEQDVDSCEGHLPTIHQDVAWASVDLGVSGESHCVLMLAST